MIAFDAPIHFCVAALTAEVPWPEVMTGQFNRMINLCFCTMSNSLWHGLRVSEDPLLGGGQSSSKNEGSIKSCTSFHHLDITASIWATSSGSVAL